MQSSRRNIVVVLAVCLSLVSGNLTAQFPESVNEQFESGSLMLIASGMLNGGTHWYHYQTTNGTERMLISTGAASRNSTTCRRTRTSSRTAPAIPPWPPSRRGLPRGFRSTLHPTAACPGIPPGIGGENPSRRHGQQLRRQVRSVPTA